MEAVFPILIILGIGAVIIFIVIFAQKQAQELRESFARVATDYGGTSLGGNLFNRPIARFNYNGAPVFVDTYSTGGKHAKYFTQVHIHWPDPTLRCEVYPESFFTRIGQFIGMTDIQIGSPAFDDAYHISGNSDDAIRTFLSPAVQSGIQAIRQQGGNDHVYVQLSGGTLLIKKLGLLREYEALAGLVALSLELYEQAQITRSAGIEFVEHSGPAQGPPTCQVCGESITTDLVHCRRCKTPHHQECWVYYGACSTYACGEKRFVAAPVRERRRA